MRGKSVPNLTCGRGDSLILKEEALESFPSRKDVIKKALPMSFRLSKPRVGGGEKEKKKNECMVLEYWCKNQAWSLVWGVRVKVDHFVLDLQYARCIQLTIDPSGLLIGGHSGISNQPTIGTDHVFCRGTVNARKKNEIPDSIITIHGHVFTLNTDAQRYIWTLSSPNEWTIESQSRYF